MLNLYYVEKNDLAFPLLYKYIFLKINFILIVIDVLHINDQILVIVFFLRKEKTQENFIKKYESNYKSEFLTKVINKNYQIEILEINPFFEKEILHIDRDINGPMVLKINTNY